ncbi:hypothetical protein V6N11_049875 [Hibiscus sabdariffa]|uniref:Uncharacterized protein n=1 Tax=Hibiscus sabdariffa TaxID=183260 RepID=A0ABR2T8C8_9ROSI
MGGTIAPPAGTGILTYGKDDLATARLLLNDNYALSSQVAVIGDVGATLVLVLGSVLGSIWKVKSVNCLVETLRSPEQRRVVVVVRSRKGHGRPTKARGLVEASCDMLNASLMDSDV